jgi:hypothetical protein
LQAEVSSRGRTPAQAAQPLEPAASIRAVRSRARLSCQAFILRLHPQANARPREGFDLSSPWAVWGKGTGGYASLAGHGDFGVVLDFSANPLTGSETYVGFVTL